MPRRFIDTATGGIVVACGPRFIGDSLFINLQPELGYRYSVSMGAWISSRFIEIK
jgi:hypothetical protein